MPAPPDVRGQLIVALDFPDSGAALQLVGRLGDAVQWYKVGLELYLREGASIVQALRDRGKRVFLDLKLHDIPNTVSGAVRSVATTGADLLSVHGSGGPAMVRSAVATAAEINPALKILAVTVLTSMSAHQLRATGSYSTPLRRARRIARMAMLAGAHGVVCSPQETAELHEIVFPMLMVVPGIRPAGSAAGDQSRTSTPAEAVAGGASMLVVGRPITRAADPCQAALAILQEMQTAADDRPA